MKIVALYKVWSGEEWLIPSIYSISPYVEKIVILTSNISWIGGYGNPAIETIKKIKKELDNIVHLNHDEPNQLKHCMHGYKYIQENFKCDYVQLIDSDEVWDSVDYENAIMYLEKNPNHKAYKTFMHTYVKSPLFRIDPPEPLRPICFIKPDLKDMGMEPRGCAIKPNVLMPNIWCHHFVFVRMHFNKVLEKLIQSHVSEKQPYETMDKWIPECWNKLPDYNKRTFPNGLHPAIGFGHNWKSIKVIERKDLPEILRVSGFPILKKWAVA